MFFEGGSVDFFFVNICHDMSSINGIEEIYSARTFSLSESKMFQMEHDTLYSIESI